MNSASLPGFVAATASAAPAAEGKPAMRDATATGNEDRFERLLRRNDAPAKKTPAAHKQEDTHSEAKTSPPIADATAPAEQADVPQDPTRDLHDWPPAALALFGIPWTPPQPATPAIPAGAANDLPDALPTTTGVMLATTDGQATPALSLLMIDTDANAAAPMEIASTDAIATATQATPGEMPAPATPLPASAAPTSHAPALAPPPPPFAQALKELTDSLRPGAEDDAPAPTINALATPTTSVNGLPRTATVNPLAAPTPELHSEHFDEAIGTRLTWMAEQKIGHAHIRMTPEQLGPVEIRLRLDGDRVHADFNSAQPEVRQALESSLPKLREMLGQHGFQLAQADVGHRQDAPSRHPAAHAQHDLPAADGVEIRGSTPTPRLSIRGLVDAYA